MRADLRRRPEDKPWQGFRLLCRDDGGGAQGYANYTVKEKWADLRDRHGDWGRDLAIYLGRKRCQYKLAQLAELAGVDYGSVGMVVKRFGARLAADAELKGLAGEVEKVQAVGKSGVVASANQSRRGKNVA